MASYNPLESLLAPLDPDRLPEDGCSPVCIWLGGILAPLPFFFFGMQCAVRQSATLLLGRGVPYPVLLTGWEAGACGGFLFCLSSLLHAHFFWGTRRSPQIRRAVEVAKTVLLIGLMLCTLFVTAAVLRRVFVFP